MEDRQIVDLYLNREEEAITRTAEKFGKLCHTIAHRILNDHSDAEECVNDTYLGMWNSIPPQRPVSLKAYISKITRNLALGKLEYHMAKKRNSYIEVSIHELDEILPDYGAFDKLEEEELGKYLNEFLRMEKESARNVFIRKYWYFDSIAEISDRFGYSQSKVKSMLYHTRERLKKFLETKEVYL